MWKKCDKIFVNPLHYNGKMIFNPSDEQLKAAGYKWIEPIAPEPVELPKRYSTLKIIRALGDQWQTYKELLTTAGVLDQFFAANYLSADDPVFMAFIATVPEELKTKLDAECIWEAN